MQIQGKQGRFVEEYLVDRCGTQAAIRAGYAARSAKEQAYRLLTKDHIRREVAQRTSHQAAELKITREQVIKGLVTAYEVAKSQGDAGAMISAAKELGKLCGFYDKPVAQSAVRGDTGALREAKRVIAAMSDEELVALAGEGVS